MKEQPTRDIKEELMDKSFEYFSKNGLENTSLRDLCKGISVSSGSMYYWFDNKEDIVITTAKYALSKSADDIFRSAMGEMTNLEKFFDKVFETLTEYSAKMRFIYQVATSPFYGERLRQKIKDLHSGYEIYAQKLGEIMGVPVDAARPLVYMFMSILLDYIVWDDEDATRMQVKALYEYACMKIKDCRQDKI